MDWTEIFKHFALYSFLATVIFGYWLYSRTKHTNSARISHSAVTSRSAYLGAASGITIGVVLLGFNVYGYMLNELVLPVVFFWLFGILLALVLAVAWVPATKGWMLTVHHWSAWIMSYLMLSLAALLFADSYVNSSAGMSMVIISLIFGILFPIILAVIGTYTNLENLSVKQSLHSQQLYFIAFQLAILARVYLV